MEITCYTKDVSSQEYLTMRKHNQSSMPSRLNMVNYDYMVDTKTVKVL